MLLKGRLSTRNVKAGESELERRGADALTAMLQQVPGIEVKGVTWKAAGAGALQAHLSAGGGNHEFVFETRSNGQPRHVRMAVQQLCACVGMKPQGVTPVLIAPYLSPQARSLCQEHGVGFLDLEGNCRLAFDTVFIERQVTSRPPVERRELRSLFKPKSAQVLRVLLRDPHRAWRVVELAEAAGVSLGHVSNVRTALLDKEWAAVGSDGLLLRDPDGLLDTWRTTYEPPRGQRTGFYTTFHGSAFEEAAREAVRAANESGAAMFASFSAAQWWAPYTRTGTHFFYADPSGREVLQQKLKLSSVSRGENVVIRILEEDDLFRDGVEIAPGVVCTSPAQTYLDLWDSGERGREAADHLRRETMSWTR